jgi:hypothetical protein
VTYEHVLSAFDELFNSKTAQVLRALKKTEVVVVLALYNEATVTQTERV